MLNYLGGISCVYQFYLFIYLFIFEYKRKRSMKPPLFSDIVPFEAEKDHWTQKSCDRIYSIFGQTAL